MKKIAILFATIALFALSCEKAPEEVAVSGISLDRPTAEIIVGETVQLKATITPSDATDQNIVWTSSKGKVAKVDSKGLVTAFAEGKTTITANASGKTATCVVTVSKKPVAVTSITLDKTAISLLKGESETLVATIKPDDATIQTVSWTSSDSGVASVDAKGKVTANAHGTATIIAKAGDQQATCDVTVTVLVEAVSLNKSELTLNLGQSETLIASVKPDDASEKTVTWTSTISSVASVDSNGTITAKATGKSIIKAKVGDKEASCLVTVVIPVESITLSQTSLTLGEGESFYVSAKVTPKNASDKTVTWSSSDERVATVDPDGTIKAIQEGTANILAQAGDQQATCIITVIKKVTSITLDKETLTLPAGSTSTLTATVLPENATDKTVTWESLDPEVATVDNGVVKGIGAGITNILATSGDIIAVCTVYVTADSADAVFAFGDRGDSETIGDVIQPGSELEFGVTNLCSGTIHVVSLQLIDGKTGASDYVKSIDSDVDSGASASWTVLIETPGIYSPTARFVYTYKGGTYTCETNLPPILQAPFHRSGDLFRSTH